MRKILSFLVPCLFGVAACAQSDPEPPLTPAAYTRTPPKTTAAARPARRTASRPAQPPKQSSPLAREAPAPVVTETEGDDSRTAITLARCEREVRCQTVGDDKEYATEDDCVTRLKPGTERELEAGECPRSIETARLGACMEAIRKEKCDSPRDLSSIGRCSAATLCPKE